MTASPERIVIVDGYSTGRDLVRELLDRNAECLHLRSTPDLPPEVASCFDPTPYDADLGYAGDVAAAIETLAELEPTAVVAGSEWGVTFADRLAHGLGLPCNRFETLSARRDKFDMIEAVRRAGLRAPAQIEVETLAAAHEWADAHGKWPIVVKPLTSAGSDGVSICNGHADIEAAFALAFGRRNFMGAVNDRLLMQEFLAGPQFIVNTVSWGGRTYVTDCWSMDVRTDGRDVIPGGLSLADPEEPRVQAMIRYTLDVVAALGIENGAGHTELKWTPEGPALIETGARVMGAAMDARSYKAAGMESQASVFAAILAGTDAEREAILDRGQYRLRKHMTKLLFNFRDSGVVQSTVGLSRLPELPTFHAHYRGLKPGDQVWKTADWLCRGGVMYLVHDDPDEIAYDVETIRILEKHGLLYGIAPIAVAA